MDTNRVSVRSRWFSALVAVLLLGTLPWLSPIGAAFGDEDHHGDHEDELLDVAMHEMDEYYDALRKSVRDPEQRAHSLAAIQKMQHWTLVAKGEQPELDDFPADERAAYQAEFRLRLVQLMRHLLDLEQAVVEGRNADAYQQVKAIAVLRRESHERFDDDDHDVDEDGHHDHDHDHED